MLRAPIAGLCLLLGPAFAMAQEWPQRPVRLIVPYVAGGGTDSVARVLAQKLGESLGQRFIVENKAGASGMIGTQAVAKGDRRRLHVSVATPAEIAINPESFKDIAYDPLADLTPVRCWRGRRCCWPPIRACSVLAGGTDQSGAVAAAQFLLARHRHAHHPDRRVHQQAARHPACAHSLSRRRRGRVRHCRRTGHAHDLRHAPGRAAPAGGALKAIAVTSKRRAANFRISRPCRDQGIRRFRFLQLVRPVRARRHAASRFWTDWRRLRC